MDEVVRPGAHHDEGVASLSSPIVVRAFLKSADDGECRIVIGRGATLTDALAFAVESAPPKKRWRVEGWNEF